MRLSEILPPLGIAATSASENGRAARRLSEAVEQRGAGALETETSSSQREPAPREGLRFGEVLSRARSSLPSDGVRDAGKDIPLASAAIVSMPIPLVHVADLEPVTLGQAIARTASQTAGPFALRAGTRETQNLLVRVSLDGSQVDLEIHGQSAEAEQQVLDNREELARRLAQYGLELRHLRRLPQEAAVRSAQSETQRDVSSEESSETSIAGRQAASAITRTSFMEVIA